MGVCIGSFTRYRITSSANELVYENEQNTLTHIAQAKPLSVRLEHPTTRDGVLLPIEGG